MLYKKNKGKSIDMELFKNPTAEYRGAPFWAWNSNLEEDMLLEQIEQMKEMGLGGFHIHSRTGMNKPYLKEEFMNLVKVCNEKAKKEDMLCWLYDEDRWPSGSAGGIVTKEVKYRARHLLFTPEDKRDDFLSKDDFLKASNKNIKTKGYFLASYGVCIKNGLLEDYIMLDENKKLKKGYEQWFVFVEIEKESPWFNNETYLNTLDKKAVEKFAQVTHDTYYKHVGEDFGNSIPAIFTDEPQFTHKESLGQAEEKKEVKLPYTDDLEESFKKEYGYSLLNHLPELIWDKKDVSYARYDYHDHVGERFAKAFSDTLGKYCENYNLMLTGHMMDEPTLFSQTKSLGDAMRSYRAFGLPGIDMLCDWREYSTAKQAQSATRQYGREGVLSELYGVTNWDFDFKGHKLQGDWQAALGVTTRVHHLNWVSMNGEAKRDYPAAIGYQSPWYKEYKYIEDHFARVNTVLTKGKPKVRVGVIHPIESYWLEFGPLEQSEFKRRQMEENFSSLIEWLLFNCIDFDFISESLLVDQWNKKDTKVGVMDYDIILVPEIKTIRQNTLSYLQNFIDNNKKVSWIGSCPSYVNARKSNLAKEIFDRAKKIQNTRYHVVTALEEARDVDIRLLDGTRTTDLMYQYREDEECDYLFIANGKKDFYEVKGEEINYIRRIEISLNGEFEPVVLDTIDGSIRDAQFVIENKKTKIWWDLSIHDSLLLMLKKNIDKRSYKVKNISYDYTKIKLPENVEYELADSNAVLLDMACYSLDGEELKEKEEILRLDNKIRKILNYPSRTTRIAQPWTQKEEEKKEHMVSLQFDVFSEIEKPVFLALENMQDTSIFFNKTQVEKIDKGYFTDKSIRRVFLGNLEKGNNTITLQIPYGKKTNLEWCYLLGDFSVRIKGSVLEIYERENKIGFSDVTNQGLPFYGDNLKYMMEIYLEKGSYVLEADKFSAPLLKILLQNEEIGVIALAPYRVYFDIKESKTYKLDIISFGNRYNSFGQLHNADENTTWFGPDSWRSKKNRWSYEYNLKRNGLLKAPLLYKIEK